MKQIVKKKKKKKKLLVKWQKQIMYSCVVKSKPQGLSASLGKKKAHLMKCTF